MMASAYMLPGGTDKIEGSLDYDADLFKFYWNGGDFFANTIDYALPMNLQKDRYLLGLTPALARITRFLRRICWRTRG